MQLGDVRHTYANIKDSKKDLKFKPQTNLEEGLEKFVNWYKEYHKINQLYNSSIIFLYFSYTLFLLIFIVGVKKAFISS